MTKLKIIIIHIYLIIHDIIPTNRIRIDIHIMSHIIFRMTDSENPEKIISGL